MSSATPEAPSEPRKQVHLYEVCPVCNGQNDDDYRCRINCSNGFIKTGVTLGQVERMSELEQLRMMAGISAAMLRDGRARKMVDALAELELWHWLTDMRLTVEENSVAGEPPWTVLDVDGDMLAGNPNQSEPLRGRQP